MGTELTVEIVESMALCAHYFAGMLDDIAHEYREKAEREKQEQQEPKEERHKWVEFYDNGIIDHRTWRTVDYRFPKDLRDGDLCIEDFAKIPERYMWRMRGIGTVSMAQISRAMEKYGIKFKEAE